MVEDIFVTCGSEEAATNGVLAVVTIKNALQLHFYPFASPARLAYPPLNADRAFFVGAGSTAAALNIKFVEGGRGSMRTYPGGTVRLTTSACAGVVGCCYCAAIVAATAAAAAAVIVAVAAAVSEKCIAYSKASFSTVTCAHRVVVRQPQCMDDALVPPGTHTPRARL